MKKLIALMITLAMLFTFVSAFAEGAAPEWDAYDQMITDIKAETDLVAREALMHDAEDMLMETSAVCPIYYYNDTFMANEDLVGYYYNAYGFKFFQYADNGGDTTLKLNLASEPDKLDPALNSSVDGACLALAGFGGLYTYNAEEKLVPHFATGYTVSDDGMTYVFDIQEGLKWSDGSPLTAKDFEYSLKRLMAEETAADYAYMYSGVVSCEASEDGLQFTVVMSAPAPYALDLFAFPAAFPVNQASVEGAEGYMDADGNVINPGAWALEAGFVSSGPFVLTEWNHDESMIYEKNPNYFDAENVKIERLELMLSADDTAILAAYENGDLDFIDSVPNDEIPRLMDKADFHTISNLGTYYGAFNVNSEVFAGKTVKQASDMRKAFSVLIDREYIAEAIGQTGQIPANAWIPEGMADGHDGIFKSNDDAYTYPVADETGYYSTKYDDMANVAEAKALLESAGFVFDGDMLSSDTPINIEYLTNNGTGHIKVAEAMQEDLSLVGINMTIKSVEWNVFLNERKAGNYDFCRDGWLADFNDPINMLEMFTSDSGNNDCQLGK